MSSTNQAPSEPSASADKPIAPGRSQRRRRMFVVCTLIAVPLLLLVAGELLVRCYLAARGWTPNVYAGSLDLFRPQDDVGYDLKPGFRLQSGTWRIHINSQGFRGPEIPPWKGRFIPRVAILGGSSAFGYLVSDGMEAARLLEDRLRADHTPTEVINAGVPSYNLYQTRRRFHDRVAPLEPDFVILYLGWNDLAYIVSDEPDAERFRIRPVASRWQRLLGRSSLYGLIAFRLLGRDATLPAAELSLTEPTEQGGERFLLNLTSLIEEAQASGAHVIVCAQATAAHPSVHPELRPFLAADPQRQEAMIELGQWLRATLREAAQSTGAEFIDANEFIPPDPMYLRDYVHLSEAGERRLAELFESRVSPRIPREGPAPEKPVEPDE